MKPSYFQIFLTSSALAFSAHAQGPGHDDHSEHAADHAPARAPAPRAPERRVNELPRGRVDVRVGNDHYYEHRGTFYHPGTRGYVVVRPPRGVIIPRLPPFAARIYFGNSLFYRYDDVYYQDTPSGYIVVDPPYAAAAPDAMPDSGAVQAQPAPAAVTASAPNGDYQSINVGSVQYFFRDGQFFQRTSDGMVWTPAPTGAVTPSLPSDATSVWYQDIEYFDSDGVYFRKTPDGYKVVNAPWIKN